MEALQVQDPELLAVVIHVNEADVDASTIVKVTSALPSELPVNCTAEALVIPSEDDTPVSDENSTNYWNV